MKTLNDYLLMNYRMEIVEDKDEGGSFHFRNFWDVLPVEKRSNTAVANALDAKKAWLEAAMDS